MPPVRRKWRHFPPADFFSMTSMKKLRVFRWSRVSGFVAAALFSAAFCRPSSAAPQMPANDDAFQRGNTLYEAGRFADAAAAYQRAFDAASGQNAAVGVNLFFNLGNAWFRAGEPGRAVLNYERALRLQPDHLEAAANLAFVRRQLGVPAAHQPGSEWERYALNWSPWLLAAGGWLLVGGTMAALLAGSGSESARTRRTARVLALAVGLPLLASGGLALWFADRGAVDPARAVLVGAEGAEARYAPADTAKVETTLPAGGEVRVLQERGSWDYVELPGGTRAWIASAQVEKIALTPGKR
jgi:tetratricopeptide (TPR) repeat protein